ncbi:unnamed protein product [Clonostachys chloroleuca]|uniref:Glycan binding protein Y3-like domain-containing protein n=1 Tax=Clonostachys chloroleuca TaxID=1926264 RepID=A0AA35Q4G1_9HYPO|nr:unnamed protein product [Clonostachys chloroleuca]
MRLSTLLVAVNYLGLASAASIANPADSLYTLNKRNCFESGVSFGSDRGTAVAKARTACNGPLKGTYRKGHSHDRSECYNLSGSKQVKFTVGLTGPNAGDSASLSFEDCLDGLSSEIYNCGKGGDTTYGHWRYRADPNEGLCRTLS